MGKVATQLMGALPAESILETATGLFGDLESMLLVAASALVVWIIVKAIWASGGALGATVVAVLVGGFMLWAVKNIDVLEEMFDDQFNEASGSVSQQIEPALAWRSDLPTSTGGRSGTSLT